MEEYQSKQQDFIYSGAQPNYVVIPIEIWTDKNLSWQERILLAEIDSFTRKDKECFMSNKYIAEFLGINETNASRVLSSLIEKGYVEKTRFDGRRRFVSSTLVTCLKQQLRLAEKSKADLPNSATYHNNITNNNITKEKEKKQCACARDTLVETLRQENQQWIETMIMHNKLKNQDEVLELASWSYDMVILEGNENPARGDVMRYSKNHLSDFREYKRRAAIKAIPIEERKDALWRESLKYKDKFSKELRDAFLLKFANASTEDPDLMIFELWPKFDMLAQLKQHKLKNEQRQSSTI